MAYKVVVPHDYGPEADAALEWSRVLVERTGGSIVLLHVILVPAPPIPRVPMIPALRPIEDSEESLEKLRAVAARHGVQVDVENFTTSDAGPGIVKRAGELKADLIALGVSVPGRGGLSRAIRGSVVDHVLWNAPCPAVAIHHGATK